MMHLVSLLVAAALLSQYCGIEANPQLDASRVLDNNLQPNVVAPSNRPRRLRKFVHILTSPAEEVQREAGQRVELECVAMGNPPPAIRWERNGEVIQDYEEQTNEILPQLSTGIIGTLTSKLVITSTTPGEDRYTCEATAGAKMESASSVVYTLTSEGEENDLLALQKIFVPSKPTITYTYNDIFSEIGNAVVLPCHSHSLTKAQVFWQDMNNRVIYGNPRMKVLPSGDLLIHELKWADMGNFTCIVKNAFGKDAAVTFVYPTKP